MIETLYRAGLGLLMMLALAACAEPGGHPEALGVSPPVALSQPDRQALILKPAAALPEEVPVGAQSPGNELAAKGGEPIQPPAPAVVARELLAFPIGSAILPEAEASKIDALAARLLQERKLIATLVAHANSNASHAYNLALSEQRLNVVLGILKNAKVPAGQIRREPVGSEKTPASCKSAECRRKFSSVEIILAPLR